MTWKIIKMLFVYEYMILYDTKLLFWSPNSNSLWVYILYMCTHLLNLQYTHMTKILGIVMFTLGYSLIPFSLLLPYAIPKIWIQHSQYVFCHLHVYDFRADQVVLRNLWHGRLFECFQKSSFLHSYEIFFLGVC